jgi:fucose 4-O-acetylase-like acetyltransferase
MTMRVTWIDAAKGFSIALVVFGHVLGGTLARGWLDDAGPWKMVYDYIYLFHMPLFFMVAGFFCIEAMRKSPVNALLAKIGSIAWPYLVWNVLVAAALMPIAGMFMSNPANVSWSEWLSKAVRGELSWFLWTLFVLQVILIPLARIPAWILFVVSLAALTFLPQPPLGAFANVVRFAPFLLFGAMIHPILGRLSIAGRWPHCAAAIAAFLLIALAYQFGLTSYALVSVVCGILGSLASILLVQCLPNALGQKLLPSLGLASLAIFVLHPYFQGAAREIITRTAGSSPYLQLLMVTTVAIAGSFAVWQAAERLGAAWLFRLRLHANFQRSSTADRLDWPDETQGKCADAAQVR